MEIYLDESGDMGFDFKQKRPSRHFVITVLACSQKLAKDRLKRAISRTLKNKVNRKARNIKHELKGSETTLKTKLYFFRHVEKLEGWALYTIVLDKEALLKATDKKPVPRNLYNRLARILLEEVGYEPNVCDVKIVVDRSKNSREVTEFNRYVANHLSSMLPVDAKLTIEHQKSLEDPCLQAVDLFAWGIFRKYESGDTQWYEAYCDRIIYERLI